MKNMNNILGLLRTSALCLTLAVMAACDAEDFTRTAGDIPGKDDLANVGGVLRREKTPDQISALKLGEEQTTTDAVSSPAHTESATVLLRGSMSVSGPGQNASASR